jgi:hypothetical protein
MYGLAPTFNLLLNTATRSSFCAATLNAVGRTLMLNRREPLIHVPVWLPCSFGVPSTLLIPSTKETLSTCRSTVRPDDPRLTTLKVQPE